MPSAKAQSGAERRKSEARRQGSCLDPTVRLSFAYFLQGREMIWAGCHAFPRAAALAGALQGWLAGWRSGKPACVVIVTALPTGQRRATMAGWLAGLGWLGWLCAVHVAAFRKPESRESRAGGLASCYYYFQ